MVATQPLCLATAAGILPYAVLRIDSKQMMRALNVDKSLAHLFQAFLLTRCVRYRQI